MTEIRAFGIDLGTTFSLVAEAQAGHARVIPLANGSASVPSVVRVRAEEVIVGAAAARAQALDPDNTIGFFKTEMGRADAAYELGGREWTPQQLSAEVLRTLTAEARASGVEVKGAVVTIPAYFGDAARLATLEAARLADVSVVELIHEPTAAAIAYGIGAVGEAPETVLVYDLGGGTFDVSVVRLAPGQIEVLATAGNHALGGKDFDDTLVEFVARQFSDVHGVDPMDDPADLALLRTQAEALKHALTELERSQCSVVAQGVADTVEVTRAVFEAQSRPLMTQTAHLMDGALDDAGLTADELDGVLLVGGSTRMPMCRKLVLERLGCQPRSGLNPNEVVALGAALRAEAMLGTRVPRVLAAARLQDVTAHALGFVVVSADGQSYVNDVMIPRNATIPANAVKRRAVATRAGGPNELNVHLLQGDNRRPRDNEPLGRFTFSGVPHGGGETVVDIAFGYDADGIVRVTATAGGDPLQPPIEDRNDIDLSWTDAPPDPARAELDVVLTIDVSYSMEDHGRLIAAKGALKEFVDQLAAGTRFGLVSFSDKAKVEAPLGSRAHEVLRAAEALRPSGGTALHLGLLCAGVQLRHDGGRSAGGLQLAASGSGRLSRRRVIVLLSDGVTDSPSALEAAASVASAGLDIVPVGLPGADMGLLEALATLDQGAFFSSVEDLAGTFRGIARELATGAGLVR